MGDDREIFDHAYDLITKGSAALAIVRDQRISQKERHMKPSDRARLAALTEINGGVGGDDLLNGMVSRVAAIIDREIEAERERCASEIEATKKFALEHYDKYAAGCVEAANSERERCARLADTAAQAVMKLSPDASLTFYLLAATIRAVLAVEGEK